MTDNVVADPDELARWERLFRNRHYRLMTLSYLILILIFALLAVGIAAFYFAPKITSYDLGSDIDARIAQNDSKLKDTNDKMNAAFKQPSEELGRRFDNLRSILDTEQREHQHTQAELGMNGQQINLLTSYNEDRLTTAKYLKSLIDGLKIPVDKTLSTEVNLKNESKLYNFTEAEWDVIAERIGADTRFDFSQEAQHALNIDIPKLNEQQVLYTNVQKRLFEEKVAETADDRRSLQASGDDQKLIFIDCYKQMLLDLAR